MTSPYLEESGPGRATNSTDGRTTTDFVWEPLSGRTYIRLLRILYETKDSELAVSSEINSPGQIRNRSQSLLPCELKSYSREEAINLGYTAMSYTWGTTSTPLQHISCNGLSMSVRRNCYDMLLKLQRMKHGSLLWIDAICINQADTNERNEQVSQMGLIFQLAKYTMVYLSKQDYQAPLAPTVSLPSLRLIPDVGLRRATIERANHGYELLSDEMNDVATLRPEIYFHSPWFTRTWIVQELMLSETVFFCSEGEDDGVVPWGVVLKAYDMWSQDFQMHDRPDVVTMRVLSDTTGLTGVNRAIRAAPCAHSIPPFAEVETPCQVCQSALKAKDLFDSLMRTRQSECVEPRDKLYAILPLLDGAWHELITPDYSKSVLEVFTDLTMFLLQNNVADVLSMASLHHSDSKWPSWVVDWSDRSPQAQRLQLSRKDIGAGCWPGVSTLHITEFQEQNILVLRGARICNVMEHIWSPDKSKIDAQQAEAGNSWVSLKTRQYPPLAGDMVCAFLGCKSLFLLRKTDIHSHLRLVDECTIQYSRASDGNVPTGSRTRVDSCYLENIMNGGALRHINPAAAYDNIPCSGLHDFEIH